MPEEEQTKAICTGPARNTGPVTPKSFPLRKTLEKQKNNGLAE